MNFHQQLFSEKGWRPSTIFAKVCLVSVMRSDMSNNRNYCQGFYHDLVDNLDKLELYTVPPIIQVMIQVQHKFYQKEFCNQLLKQ